MSTPKVAIIGASGYIGQFICEKGFLPSLSEGKFSEVRVLSTKKSETIEKLTSQGATLSLVDYSSVPSLVTALTGIDIVISCMGTGDGVEESKTNLLDALVQVGVKVYFPSEFGTNHYTRVPCNLSTHPIFAKKKEHFEASKQKGIKTIAILCSDIMESTFGPWFGLNNTTEVWNLVGTGNVPVAVTAERDLAKFTVQAALKAVDPSVCIPEFIEVYSDMKTLREYSAEFDKVAGRATKLEFTPITEALSDYESAGKPFESLIQILFEEGAYDYTTSGEGNELLNPGESIWKLKKITEYAEETGGRPWKDFK